jgi:hypothetical protein
LATFLDGNWIPHPNRTDTIPSTQNGMGILSYLKFRQFCGGEDTVYLNTAASMGEYLLKEALTPQSGRYPAFTRSTGSRDQFPLSADCGSQADRPYEIEPDKGGSAGYALMLLSEAGRERRCLEQALHNARVLAANQADADARSSPWPFRADYRNGEGRGDVSGNMSYILRLCDGLLARGYEEFSGPRQSLWNWILRYEIPSASTDGGLFAQFFEDHDTPTNRSAWAPLNLARCLLEKREVLDPEWRAHSGALVDFVRRPFTHSEFGITVRHEQDEDEQAWGGINSTYGAVLALYAKAVESGGRRLAGGCAHRRHSQLCGCARCLSGVGRCGMTGSTRADAGLSRGDPGLHTRRLPEKTVVVFPPTQTPPSASVLMRTRPLRPKRVPWEAI